MCRKHVALSVTPPHPVLQRVGTMVTNEISLIVGARARDDLLTDQHLFRSRLGEQ